MNTAVLIGRALIKNPHINVNTLATELHISPGTISKQLKDMSDTGLLATGNDGEYFLTDTGMIFMKKYKVDNAIITAAGFGSRFVPLSYDMPKGLLEVHGERMVERQIKQLREAGITDITIVVGYLKEKFEYLVDKYNVKLIYNPEYSSKNSLSTLYYIRHLLKNTYILASDNWLRDNIYNEYEPAAWYSGAYMKGHTSEWCLITDQNNRVTDVQIGGTDSYVMYGPAYFDRDFSDKYRTYVEEYYNTPGTENFYWEQIVKDKLHDLKFYCNCRPDNTIYEFENLEELRLFDSKYCTSSGNNALAYIAQMFNVSENEITGFKCPKAAAADKSFIFTVKGETYICSIPGKDTDNAYKITRYFE